MLIYYSSYGGYVPPTTDLGASGTVTQLVRDNAPRINFNECALPTLMQPIISTGVGSYAYWKFTPPLDINKHTIPYGTQGYEEVEAPGYYEMLFDPTLSRYALEHDGIDNASVMVSFTETVTYEARYYSDGSSTPGSVSVFDRSYSAVNEPLDVQFITDVRRDYATGRKITYSYSDVIVKIRCWRTGGTTGYGPHYAVLRTSNPSELTDWVQEPQREAVVTMQEVGGAVSAHYEAEKTTVVTPSPGYSSYRVSGHRGDMEYYRAFGGPWPWNQPLAGNLAWATAVEGTGPGGVNYYNEDGAVEYTGPPDGPLDAISLTNGGWGGADVGASYTWSGSGLGGVGSSEVNIYGAGYTIPFDGVEYLQLGRRGNASADYNDIATEYGGFYSGNYEDPEMVMGIYWARRNCIIKDILVAPDHEAGALRSSEVVTRWVCGLPANSPSGYGPHYSVSSSDTSKSINLQLATGGGGSVGGWIGGQQQLFTYTGSKVDWVPVDWQSSYQLMKSLTELYYEDTGTIIESTKSGLLYFSAIPVGADSGSLPGWLPNGAEGTASGGALKYNASEHLAFKFLVEPAPYRVHLKAELEYALPLYPEQSIDGNFKLARRRFTGR